MIKLNNIAIDVTKFPDRTSQVWKLPEELIRSENDIVWQFESEAELMHLAQLQYLLKSRQCTATLTMPYLPYARQDKSINNTETFALRPFLSIINHLAFRTVSAFDPHNEGVIHDHLDNFIALSPLSSITNAIRIATPDLICYPDAGARTRYSKILNHANIYASKVRNQTTGAVVSLKIIGECASKSVLIVDDICDGGMTFIKLAETLRTENKVQAISLYISHGLFSKGIDVLRQAGIERIFTQNGEIK